MSCLRSKLRSTVCASLVALLVAGGSGSALASDFPAIDRARSQVQRRALKHDSSKRNLRVARNEYESLAHRIAALKRLGARPNTDTTLEKLLQQSVAMGAELEKKADAKDRAAKRVDDALAAAIRDTNSEIRRRKAGLRTGSLAKRKKTAAALRKLIEIRKALKRQRAEFKSERTTPRHWKQYEVQIDPLDGPSDLDAKADFLADQRDKFRKKRSQLAELIADAKQAREIARAADAFQTDTRTFDDDFRAGRVARDPSVARNAGGGGPAILAGAADQEATNNRASPPAQPEEAVNVPQAGAQSPDVTGGGGGAGAGNGNTNSPPPAPSDPGGGRGTDGFMGTPTDDATDVDNDVPGRGTTAPPVVNVETPGGTTTLPRQLDPNALLNLTIEGLAAGNLDVKELQALLKDLAKLDAYLAERSREIRRRARQLEQDEARVLGK